MIKQMSALIASIFMLFTHLPAQALNSVAYPSEIAVLTLPEQEDIQWKEISRHVTNKEGLVERIPIDQSVEDWKNLICFQFMDRSNFGKNGKKSIDDIIESIRTTTMASYPGNKVTWKILEKNKNAVTYEWILHDTYEHVPPQHEISRAILTKTGFHRIGYTKQNVMLTPDERQKWICLLKDSFSIMPVDQAQQIKKGLSIVNKSRQSLDLGPLFNGWKSVDPVLLENGITIETLIPSSQKKSLITESLGVVTMPSAEGLTVDDYFESEQETLSKAVSKKIQFDVHKKTAHELLYSYSYPDNNLQFTSVVRVVTTDLGFYAISYKKGLKKNLNKDEILDWKKKLEAIQIHSN